MKVKNTVTIALLVTINLTKEKPRAWLVNLDTHNLALATILVPLVHLAHSLILPHHPVATTVVQDTTNLTVLKLTALLAHLVMLSR